jgi:hypothetical protein
MDQLEDGSLALDLNLDVVFVISAFEEVPKVLGSVYQSKLIG